MGSLTENPRLNFRDDDLRLNTHTQDCFDLVDPQIQNTKRDVTLRGKVSYILTGKNLGDKKIPIK